MNYAVNPANPQRSLEAAKFLIEKVHKFWEMRSPIGMLTNTPMQDALEMETLIGKYTLPLAPQKGTELVGLLRHASEKRQSSPADGPSAKKQKR